jgi:hypothetical protein
VSARLPPVAPRPPAPMLQQKKQTRVPLVCGNKSEKFTSAAACNLERPLIFRLAEWFSDFPRSFPLYWAPLIIAAVFPSLARARTDFLPPTFCSTPAKVHPSLCWNNACSAAETRANVNWLLPHLPESSLDKLICASVNTAQEVFRLIYARGTGEVAF